MNGVVVDIDSERPTAALTQATLTTDTVLQVDNAAIFDPDGGTLVINTASVAYTSASEAANTATLSAAVGTVYEVGVPVASANAVASYAIVQPADPDADEIRVTLPPDRAPTIAIGDPVVAELHGSAWVLSRSVNVERGAVVALERGTPSSTTITMTTSTWTEVFFDRLNDLYESQFTQHSGGGIAQVAGTYWVKASVGFVGNATGQRRVRITKNGAVWYQSNANAGTTQIVTVTAQGLIPLDPGDELLVDAWQNSGGDLGNDSSPEYTNFNAFRI
jgi:hypothetical protein